METSSQRRTVTLREARVFGATWLCSTSVKLRTLVSTLLQRRDVQSVREHHNTTPHSRHDGITGSRRLTYSCCLQFRGWEQTAECGWWLNDMIRCFYWWDTYWRVKKITILHTHNARSEDYLYCCTIAGWRLCNCTINNVVPGLRTKIWPGRSHDTPADLVCPVFTVSPPLLYPRDRI